MRWPFRRGDEGLGAQNPAPAPPSPVPAVPEGAAGPASAPSAAPSWTSLAPIGPSWSAQTPLTTGPQPTRPPLVQEPHRRARPRVAADGTPEPGRVVGLAAVVVPPPAEPVAATELPAYFQQQPPLRHVTARPVIEHAPLTEANSDYVGAPVAPPPPTPAPSFPSQPPITQPTREAATDAGARFEEALANLHRSGLPKYLPGGAVEQEPAAPVSPPPVPAPPAESGPSPSPAPLPPLTHRRASLAESRRLGLGAPIPAIPTSEDQAAQVAEAAAQAAEAAHAALAAETAAAPPIPPTPPAPRHRAALSGETDGGGGEPPQTREPLRTAPVVRPITDGSARPTASTAPLVFRAAPRPVEVRPAEPARPAERAVVTRPPADLAQALRSSHGVDVTDVPVRRDSDAGSEARQRRARAFTRGATVYLPEDAGAVTTPQARGLLAHELVHAAQQRRLGGALPAADTAAGQALEAEALQAERMHGGTPPTIGSSQPLRHAPAPVTANWVEDRITQLADVAAPTWEYTLGEQAQQEVAYIAQEETYRIIGETGGGGGGGGGSTSTPGPRSGRGSSSSSPRSSSSSTSGSSSTTTVPLPLDESLTKGAPAATSAREVGVGTGQATTLTEFQTNWLASWNMIRQNQGQGPITLAELSSDDRAMIETRWNEARALKEQERLNRDRIARFAPPGGLGNQSWTRGGGLTSGDTTTPPSTDTDTSTTPEDVSAVTGTRTGPPRGGVGFARNAAAAVGVGVGQATTIEEFRRNLFDSMNQIRENQGLPKMRDISELSQEQLDWSAKLFKDANEHKAAEARNKARIASFTSQGQPRTGGPGTTTTAGSGATTALLAATEAGSTTQHGGTHVVPHSAQGPMSTHDQTSIDSSHLDIEELSTRIYDRLRTKLRTELLIDRERAGLLTDFR